MYFLISTFVNLLYSSTIKYMSKITNKLKAIEEYRETRNVSLDNDFMLAITSNLLNNLSVRNNFIHLLLRSYKKQDKKVDSTLKIATGLYICSLITCWETFFRDLFIFISNHDDKIKRRLSIEISGTIPLELTIGEYLARKYNFQNLNQTHEAFDYIFQNKTKELTEYFTNDIFNDAIYIENAIIFKWICEGVFKEKVDIILQTAFEIRHRITHDANYIIDFNSKLLSEIECVFQMVPQFFISNIAAKYSQKRVVFNIKEHYLRITDNPNEHEKPYAFNVKDFMADDYKII